MGGCIGKKTNVVITRMSNKTNYYNEFSIEDKQKNKIIEKGLKKNKALISDICKDLKVSVIQVYENDDINNTESFREILRCLN